MSEPMTETALGAIRESGMTRYEIARQSGVSQAVLSRFVNGKSTISLQNLEKIAGIVGLRLTLNGRRKRGRA